MQRRSAWTTGPARHAAAPLFFLALALVATRPLGRDLAGQTLRGPDPLIDMWTVHWLTGHALDPGRVFEGNLYHPHRRAVLHSDLSLGSAVLVLPLRPLVRDPVPLYNLALLAALAFGGWAFHALVRALTGDPWAGLLAGVLAAFGSHQLYHVYHLNLLSIGWLALLLLALHHIDQRPTVGAALLAGVSFALSAQSSGYYAVAGALLALLFALLHPRVFTGRRLLAAAGAALLAALLVLPYARAFLALREEAGLRRPLGMSVRMAFVPQRDLGSRAFAYGALVPGDEDGERFFPGLLAPALALVALARRRPGAGFYVAAGAALLLVSLGPQLRFGEQQLTLPYRWLFALPPLDSMRHPYTFAAVAGFCLAVLAGLGAAALRGRAWLGPALLGVAVLETLGPAVGVRAVAPGVPEVYARLPAFPPGAVLEVPPFEAETVLWAARHGLPVVNGIGAFAPPQTARLENQIRAHWLGAPPGDVDASVPTRLLLEHFDLRYLVVAAGDRPAARRLAAALDRSRRYRLLAEYRDGRRLYELVRAP